MRVFDFDNTIYNGESVFDFFLFSIKHKPSVIKYIGVVVHNLIKYKLGKTTMEDLEQGFKKYAHSYLSLFDNPERLVIQFWDGHMKNIKPWYKPQQDDIIITASFDVIMDEVCQRLGVESCICSKIDRESLNVTYINFNHNKLKRFQVLYGENTIIDEFYTDNAFDLPMMSISKSAYIVKGNEIKKVK